MLHFNVCAIILGVRDTWKRSFQIVLVQQVMHNHAFCTEEWKLIYMYTYTHLHFYGTFCAEFAGNHREGRLRSYESTLNTIVSQNTQAMYSLHVDKIYTCDMRNVRLWVFGCFVNNKGRHLFTGKCWRREIVITDLQTFVCTWELEGLHLIFFFLGKEIPSPPKFVVILIKVKPRMKLHLG